MRKLLMIATVVLLTCSAVSVGAKGDDPEKAPEARPGAGRTVYMDISALGRKTRAARRMTESHQAYFAKGWIVIDVEPYVENGDLQGFFITYVGRE